MSDINDDILNYELGDVDIEDVLAGDEDDLLLSDEEAPQEKKLSTQQKQQLLDDTEEWVSLELAKASVKTNATDKIKIGAGKLEKVEKKIIDVKVDSSSSVELLVTKESEITTSDEAAIIKPSLSTGTTEETSSDEKLSSTQQSVKPKLNRAILKKDKMFTTVNEVSSSVEDIKSKIVTEDKLVIEDKLESTYNLEIPPSRSEIDSNTKDGSLRDEPGSEDTDSVAKRSEVEDEADDEREERLNPKLSVERDNESGYPNGMPKKHLKQSNSGVPHHENQIPRIGYAPHQHRGPYPQPHGPHSIVNMSNEYHPHQQYQSTPNYHNPQAIRGPSIPQPYRVPLHSGPGGPQSHGPPHNDYGLQVPYRGPRPEHMQQNQPPYAPFNAIIVRPQGNMLGPPRFDQMRPRQPGPPQFGNPNMQPRPPLHQPNYLPPRPPGISPQNLPPMPNQSAQSMPHNQQQQPPVMPRKILINPNFKHGGWEAAKSQLIMDNILNKNIISSIGMTPAQNDDELLRQQEAFITQNRIHIEKRRYERSPDRDRDHRDRDYSPPPRRERRPYSRERDLGPRNDYKQRPKRDGDNYDTRYNPKRRRSESLERDIKEKVEEDEETRAYRLEIEKQKAMREKIVREKEERRKKAAEDKLNTITKEKKPVSEEVPAGGQPPKLTPLIVKESKIISLKKKAASNPAKAIPTAKIIPESKRMLEATLHGKSDSTTAVVKPQMKTIVIKNNLSMKKGGSDTNDEDDEDQEEEEEQAEEEEDDEVDNIEENPEEEEDEIDEDALLADSPSPPPTPPLDTFRTRRVILKSSSKSSADTTNSKILQTKTFSINNSDDSGSGKIRSTTGSKGIFDRLDHQKKIGVNESVKRSIKRIVINKSD